MDVYQLRVNETLSMDATDGLRDLIAQPLSYRLRVASELAELVAFLSERSAARPGSPYILCDPSLSNFLVARDGSVKFADLDNIKPMTPSVLYPFFYSVNEDELHRPLSARKQRMGSSDEDSGLRLFEGKKCSEGCSYVCLFHHLWSFRTNGSEFRCKTPKDKYWPGLGARASTYWLASIFLKPLLGHEWQRLPNVVALIQQCLQLQEELRPHPRVVAKTLRSVTIS